MNARGARVLYIDDDEGLRELVRRAMGRRGYEVSLAANGAAGVAMATEGDFDLIAIDHYMPGMDGLATLNTLFALPDPPPLIYVTGSDESRIAVAALKAGADDYVVKSLGDEFFDLLNGVFVQALEKVRLRRGKLEAEEALKRANAELELVVQRQEALLREVNHRVANSLQLVSALVHLQAAAVADPAAKGALIDTQARIKAITQVHRKLYTSDDVETVDIAEYLGSLLEELEQTWSTERSPRRLVLIAEAVRMSPDKAVSLGVIVSELVTNACKYAYAAGAAGEVRIHLKRDGDGALLTVEDDGPGMSDKPAQGTGLGRKVIGAMAASLGSVVDFDAGHAGVRAVVRMGL